MAETESSSPQPEEVPAKIWEYDWPTDSVVDELSNSQSAASWFKVFDTNPEALGPLAHGLANLMQGGNLPNPDELDAYVNHPLIKDRTLRLCNLIFYSHAGTEINSLPRAVVLLGAKTVRNLCFVTAIINRVLTEPTPKYILPEIVRLYLAGTFEVLIMRRVKAKVLNAEENFMAGSMSHLSRLLVIYFGGERSKLLEQKANEAKTPVTADLVQKVFGFKELELNQSFASRWHLGDTLIKCLHDEENDEHSLAIYRCAQLFTKGLFNGHQSKEYLEAKDQIMALCHLSSEHVHDLMLEGLERTMEGLSFYDNPDLLEYVPYPHEEEEATNKGYEESTEYKGEPDPELVKAKIKQLAAMATKEGVEFDEVMQVVIEGLYEGCDLDRSAIWITDQRNKQAQIRYLQQIDSTELFQKYEIKDSKAYYAQDVSLDLRKSEGFLIRNILREHKIAWVSKASSAIIRKLRNNAFNNKVGHGQFFVAPMIINKVKLGFYIADRQLSQRKLDNQSYNLFTDLIEQANLTLEAMK